jgi:hypothetical protein
VEREFSPEELINAEFCQRAIEPEMGSIQKFR